MAIILSDFNRSGHQIRIISPLYSFNFSHNSDQPAPTPFDPRKVRIVDIFEPCCLVVNFAASQATRQRGPRDLKGFIRRSSDGTEVKGVTIGLLAMMIHDAHPSLRPTGSRK
jgi:hypothetical protein